MRAQDAGGQFRLLGQRRYGPFFWTVFLGSVNDNLLKFAVTLLLTYQAHVDWLPGHLVGPVTGALFIAPSLMLSPWAGRVADRLPLDRLIRLGKAAEVLMMVLAVAMVAAGSAAGMLFCLVLSGVHVTWFATIKYAYVPRHLAAHELLGGNGLLETGLFMAIILGTLAAGLGVAEGGSLIALGGMLVGLALVGWFWSHWIPPTPPSCGSGATVQVEPPVTGLLAALRAGRPGGHVMESVLGISWMWFFGAMFLTLFPVLTRDVLHADASVATLLLALTSVGIGVGALMCEAWGRGRDPAGLVLLGALAMAVFGGDLAWSVMVLDERSPPSRLWTATSFVLQSEHLRLLVDLPLMAMGVGWFSVPLYAQMQAEAAPSRRARVVAANNVLNALFILASAGMAAGLSAVGLGVGGVLMATVALHGGCGLVVIALRPRWRRAFAALWPGRDAWRAVRRD